MSDRGTNSRFPHLGKLSLAILEHLVESVIGGPAIEEAKAPLVQHELHDSLIKALEQTERRFVADSHIDPVIRDAILNLPLSNLPSVVQATHGFYLRPTELTLEEILNKQLAMAFPQLIAQSIRAGVSAYLQVLREELAILSPDIRQKLDTISNLRMANNLESIDRKLGRIVTGVEHFEPSLHSREPIDEAERLRLVDLYLKRVIAITKQLPWGYLPGDFAAELGMDDVYVLPRFSTREYRRVSVSDEWLERELIRQSDPSKEKREDTQRRIARAEKPLYLTLSEIVRSGVNAALLGYMGTGKSMAANYIALRLAKGEGQKILGYSKPKLPILLRLGGVRRTPDSDLVTFAIENATFKLDHAEVLQKILKQEWVAGNAVLILDALDEFRGEMQWISDEIACLSEVGGGGSNVLLTSRPSVYRSVRMVGLKTFTLEELQKEDTFDFIETWARAYNKVARRTDISPCDYTRSLIYEIEKHPLVQDIASNQLLLTILITLSFRPSSISLDQVTEAQLFNAYIADLIEWERSKGAEAPVKYGTELLRIAFSYMGFEVQRSQSGMSGEICTYPSLLRTLSESKHLRNLGKPATDVETILRFWLNSGLIQQADDESTSIRFRHQAFQYFGAALAMTYQSKERLGKILADVEANPEWTDVLRLYLGLKAHSQSALE